MSKVDIKVNYGEVGKLLKSEEVKTMLLQRANELKSRAGDDYVVNARRWPTRGVVEVETKDDYDAKRREAENNILLKAVGGMQV